MKLTLRDLFWLVLVAAMGCAWWLERLTREPPYYQEDDIQYFGPGETDWDNVEAYPVAPIHEPIHPAILNDTCCSGRHDETSAL